jgi:hypothetical protein
LPGVPMTKQTLFYDHLSLRDCNFPPRAILFSMESAWAPASPFLSGIVYGPTSAHHRTSQLVPRGMHVNEHVHGFTSIW